MWGWVPQGARCESEVTWEPAICMRPGSPGGDAYFSGFSSPSVKWVQPSTPSQAAAEPCTECIQDLAQGLVPSRLSSTLAIGIPSSKPVSLSTLHAGVPPKAFNNHQSPG